MLSIFKPLDNRRIFYDIITTMIASILKEYFKFYPTEEKDLSLAIKQAKSSRSDQELFDRKNFVGHFTASIFLICPSEKKILLLDHKSLKKFLQPGGHIESADKNPLDAALRELFEETKISREQISYRPLDPANKLVPLHISSHFIPENPKKKELGHYHHDLEYLFTINETKDIAIDQNESNGFEWVDLDLFLKQEHFNSIIPKIYAIISSKERIS